jgi:hypothetical protein
MFLAGLAFLSTENEGLALQIFNTARQATKVPEKLCAIWNNIGCALQERDPEQAYAAFHEALRFGLSRSTYDNLCNVSSQIGKHEEALTWAAKALESGSNDPSYNRSFALFHLGRWSEAWPEYDKSVGQRPGTDRNYTPDAQTPRWDGVSPGTVVIHGEQGIGDELMFASMIPADWDGVIECNARNEGLFARSFPKARVYGTLGQTYLEWVADECPIYKLEMGGLGKLYAPAPFKCGAYLKSDVAKWEAMRSWLSVVGDDLLRPFRIGVAWTGGAWNTGRGRRSVPFADMQRLLQIPGVTFVNLEYEDRREELAELKEATGVEVLNPVWATRKGADMDDLAALVSALDLVIAPTTSVVDLCGALGVECWAMVDEHPQWRYAHVAGAERMWFYESVRCFRQQARDRGSWARAVGEVSAALRERVGMKDAA